MSTLKTGWRPKTAASAATEVKGWAWLEPRLADLYDLALADGREKATEMAAIIRGVYRAGLANAEDGVLAAQNAAGRVLELCAALDTPTLSGPSLLRAARETFDYHRPKATAAAEAAFE